MGRMLGEVDLLGLNQFGENPGISPIYGTLIGGGVASVAKVALARMGKPNPNFWGFVVGGLTAGGMYFAGKMTRHAALGAAAGAFLAAGVDWLMGEMLNSGTPTAGVGIPQIQYLNGPMGLPQVEYLNGAGNLGLPGIAPVPPSYGTIPGVYGAGVAGPQFGQSPPVDLLGQGGATQDQVQLLGGPTLSGLASAYGATLLGNH